VSWSFLGRGKSQRVWREEASDGKNVTCMCDQKLYWAISLLCFLQSCYHHDIVGSLQTLRLGSFKLVFQSLHTFLVNRLSFWQVGLGHLLCAWHKSFSQELFRDLLFHLRFTVSQFQWVRSLHTLRWLCL
jgi:hypothetical protein